MEAEDEGLHAGNGRQAAAVEETLEAAGQTEAGQESAAPSGATSGAGTGKRRRRGRRGGRKRRGRGGAGQQAVGEAVPQRATMPGRQPSPRFMPTGAGEAAAERPVSYEPRRVEPPSRHEGGAEPYARPVGGLVAGRSRAGDPGLSSRIAQLESQLRRLLACPLASLDDADQAPAGPGVLLLSDSDQVTHYYVEACQTLRIGIGNLLRGGRGSRGGAQLKPLLAEHLGINESRVAKYLKDHCAVRWIQLDEGAAELAHFATAVLRPVVAE
jgi:hypothetical protein